jgi:SSS family solute:Na+ symporter
LAFYVGLGALILNVAVAAIANVVVGWVSPNRRDSAIAPS